VDLNTATSVIDRDFATFDTAYQNNAGKTDGKIGEDDLRAVAENRGDRFSGEQQAAAQFLLDSRASYAMLDVGARNGSVDGTISREDIAGALETIGSGTYLDELLDTAAGSGSRDGNVSDRDLTAALADPGIPQEVKDTINVLLLAPEGSADLHQVLQGITANEAASLGSLYGSPQFNALSGDDKQLVGQAVRDSGADQNVTSSVRELLEGPRFGTMSAQQRTSALSEIALVNSSAFQALPSADQQHIRDSLRAGSADPAFAIELHGLVQSQPFADLDPAAKTAVLSQIDNYPRTDVTRNIGLALDKDWFQGQSVEDQQRSLKLVAHLTQHDSGDQAVIDGTLDRFLSPDSDYRLEWKSISASPGNITFGYADGNTLTLNSDLVDANNNRVGGGYEADVIENTTAHEVSHLVNGDRTNQTFHYLNEEYRAWYVGHLAEHGQPPSNQEAMDRWEYFLNPDGGYADYSHGTEGSWFFNVGAKDGALDKPDEARQIFALMSELSGLEVTADNYQDVMAHPENWTTDPNAPASDDVFPSTDDLDN
jgi:hypothetical protein